MVSLVLFISTAPPASAEAVTWNKIGYWPMYGGAGESRAVDWWGEANTGYVRDRNQVTSGHFGGWAYRFKGTNKDSRIVIHNNRGLSPGTKDFLVSARIRYTNDLPYGASWNVVQRGRANRDAIGGQWKLEIARAALRWGGKVYFKCVFRRPGSTQPFLVKVFDAGQSLKKNVSYDVTCRLDRSSNANALVHAEITNRSTNNKSRPPAKNTGIPNSAFGSINPRGTSCPLGHKTTIGGKAYCANENPGPAGLSEDMYKGYIQSVKIWKGS